LVPKIYDVMVQPGAVDFSQQVIINAPGNVDAPHFGTQCTCKGHHVYLGVPVRFNVSDFGHFTLHFDAAGQQV
jgi:hypothetical protein